MNSHFFAMLAFVLGASGVTGCASYKAFDPDRTSVDADSYVVAMSINTMVQGGKPVQADEPLFLMDELRIAGTKPLNIYETQPGLALLVIEVPHGELDLETLKLSWRQPGNGWQKFQTATAGPEVSLEAGAVNYLGSLTVAGSTVEDDAKPQPTKVDLRFVDGWESDAESWKKFYAVFAANEPNKVIAGSWADAGDVELQPVTSSRRSAGKTDSPIRSYQENPRRLDMTRAIRQPY
jgi:hypothetical protein